MTLSEILNRDDVKYHLKLKEEKIREYYKRYYAYRISGFYHQYGLMLPLHRKTLSVVQNTYDITEREFEVLGAHYVMGWAWGLKRYSPRNETYDLYLSHIAKSTYSSTMRSLIDKGYVRKFKSVESPSINKIIKTYKREGDHMFKHSDKAITMLTYYNQQMGMVLSAFCRKTPLLASMVEKAIDNALEVSKELKLHKKNVGKEDILHGEISLIERYRKIHNG
jgi:hypothetical protein